MMIGAGIALKTFKTDYTKENCRFFTTQPFVRCYVDFDYDGHPCPVYQEFTFNNQGEMTFNEAWSNYPSLLPMPAGDTWAEGDDVRRLSTKVPGLGNAKGRINVNSPYWDELALIDPDFADYAKRARSPATYFAQDLLAEKEHSAGGFGLSSCDPPKK